MDQVMEELTVAKSKYRMDPEELVQLIKDLKRYMRLAHKAKTEMVKPTCVWSFQSQRNTQTVVSLSLI